MRDLQSVSNQVNKTQGVMAGLGKNFGQIGKGFTQVGAGLLRIGETMAVAGLVAVGASAKIGTSFQAMTELIHTQAGASQAEVDTMRVAIQDMVHSVGTSPIELAKGLYHIESVGVRGAAALDILKASALGAKVGLADMESVTNALTAVWFSGIKGAKSMTDAMAILDGIVGVGNMHLQDLTDSFKSGILGTAATYGVDIRSLGAAIATLTDAGVPADIAATRLNNTLTHLAAPTKQAIGVLKDLGLGQFDLAKALRKPDGLFSALSVLHDALVKQGEIVNGKLTPQGAADMSKLFGGSRFGATAMQLLTQMDRVEQKYKLITARSATFGDNVKKTMETAGFVWGQFKADVEESALAFSDGFLPALARAGSKLDAFLVGHHGDIVNLGKDLGTWLDNVNWTQVTDGANTFIGVMKTALELISKIPPEVDAVVASFLVLNKVSGGLLGKGIENIVGGVTGLVGTLGKGLLRAGLSKIPVIGGALAAATSTPVFVTNWPLGFGLPGGAGPLEGLVAAGGGLAIPVILTAATIAALGIAFVSAMSQIPDVVPPEKGGTPGQVFSPGRGFGPRSGHDQRTDLTTSGGLSPDDRQALHDAAAAFDTRSEGFHIEKANNELIAQFGKLGTALGKLGVAAADASKIGLLPAKVQKTLSMSLHDIVSGINERSQAKYHWKDGKPPASWTAGTLDRELIRTENKILHSHQSAAVKLAGLERLQKLAVAGKDWGVATKLKREIADLRSQAKTAASQQRTAQLAVKTAVAAVTAAVKAKDLSVKVNVGGDTQINNFRIGIGETSLVQTTYRKLGGVTVS